MIGIAARRYVLPIGSSTIVTFSLLLLMQALIHGEGVFVAAPISPPIEFVRVLEERDLIKNPRKVEPPPEVEIAPPAVITGPAIESSEWPVVTVRPPVIGPIGDRIGSGMAVPIVEPAPHYPERCAARGIEGSVLVRFDISTVGAPERIEIVDADPAGCFERAALGAVARYRYRPASSGDQPVAVRGVLKRISFRLEP